MERRIVITGIGIVSPLGSDPGVLWGRWDRGESAVRDHEFPGREVFAHGACARTPDEAWDGLIPNRKLVKFMNREARMTAAAASLALADAGARGAYLPERTGLYVGTGMTSCEMEALVPVLEGSFAADGAFSCRRLGDEGLAACNPLLSFKILPNMTLCCISMLHDIRGDNLVFNPWPGTTAQAIIAGARAIRWGLADAALAGGGDCKTHFIGFLTLAQLGLLSASGSCRPFEADGDGLVPGEGACILHLEDAESAGRRGARIYAELAGYGEGTDGGSAGPVPGHPEVLAETMADALSAAGSRPSDIDAVFCSSGSHPRGDLAEAQALAAVFSPPPPISSLKPVCGDLLAAAPALAAGVAAFALGNRLSPPVLEVRTPAAGLPPDLLAGRPRRRPPEAILVNALDLGSATASLVLRRHR